MHKRRRLRNTAMALIPCTGIAFAAYAATEACVGPVGGYCAAQGAKCTVGTVTGTMLADVSPVTNCGTMNPGYSDCTAPNTVSCNYMCGSDTQGYTSGSTSTKDGATNGQTGCSS